MSSYVHKSFPIGLLDRRSSDLTVAKDIRIFGLRSWLDDLYAKSMAAYTAFKRKEQGVYIWASVTILNNPFVVIGVIIVMLAVTFIAPMLNNKAGSYYAKHANDHNLGNRLFGFFGWLGYYSNLATPSV